MELVEMERTARTLTLAALIIAIFSFATITAGATAESSSANTASVIHDGTMMTVNNLDPSVGGAAAAGYDQNGKFVFAKIQAVQNGSVSFDLSGYSEITFKLFQFGSTQTCTPLGQPLAFTQNKLTRVVLAEKLSAFGKIATGSYDPVKIKYTDCASLTDSQKMAVMAVTDQGFMGGTSASTFSPYSYITRAQTVITLYRILGSPTSTMTSSPYSDVAKDSWYGNDILAVYEKGALPKTPTFSPNNITYEHDIEAWLAAAQAS
jgi:hypothetical protein